MSLIVMKFGGTSVGSATAMQQVGRVVDAAAPRTPLVVLSAMAGATNALFEAARAAESGDAATARAMRKQLVEQHIDCARELFGPELPEAVDLGLQKLFDELRVLLRGVSLLRELSPRSMDALASLGERVSTWIFAHWYAHTRGADKAAWFDARTVMCTDARFGSARPRLDATRERCRTELHPPLAAGRTIVTQGYIGATEDGLTTTLGRGGSDYSAALLGAALQVEEVQIWTDVEGILTCDPRVVPDALPIREISFAEAAELAAFGAKVLHPATIQPAVEAEIPVTVRHTHKPDGAFTTIAATVPQARPVTALASRGPVTVLTVSSLRMLEQSGFLGRLFEVFGRLGVSVDLVATAEVSVSLTIEPTAPLREVLSELAAFAHVEVQTDRSIVAVVGERIRSTQGLMERVFGALREVQVQMISMGANEINLSVVVPVAQAPDALRALHRELVASTVEASS